MGNDKIQLFEDQPIRTAWVEDEEEWYFSIVDVVGALSESKDPITYWRKLKQRLKEEGNETVTNCHALKMTARDGKKRLTDVANTEQLLRIIQSIHTRHLVRDKGMYRSYNWTDNQRRDLLIDITKLICNLDIKITNVIIDKTKIKTSNYNVLENALKYNIQRVENTSRGEWNYMIITDEGRLPPMRKTARAIRAYNPVQSHFGGVQNIPIKGLIEDVLAKDSDESYFIQLCDFVSFFADLYFRCVDKGEMLPKRVERVVDSIFIKWLFAKLREGDVLNLKASNKHDFGFVIYPK